MKPKDKLIDAVKDGSLLEALQDNVDCYLDGIQEYLPSGSDDIISGVQQSMIKTFKQFQTKDEIKRKTQK